MQEKSLPIINQVKKLLTTLSKRLPEKDRSETLPSKQKRSDRFKKQPSPNLLESVDTNVVVKASSLLEKINVLIVPPIVISFFILLTVNSQLDKKLNLLKEKRDELVISLEMSKQGEEKLLKVASQIETYKNKTKSYEKVAPKLEKVLEVVNDCCDNESFSYTGTERTINFNLSSDRAVSYAHLIDGILKIDFVESMTLRSVELDQDRYIGKVLISLK